MVKEGDIVLCKVRRIEGTCVFVDVEGSQRGTIVFSEIAAGRIRNIREYVSVGKQIVCKILRVEKDHLELSLRRVTGKERDQVLDRVKKERAFRNILKIVGEDADKIIEKIKADEGDIAEFLWDVKGNPGLLEKYFPPEKALKVSQIISEKEGREKTAESRFVLKSFSESGLRDIKNMLAPIKCEVHYLGSSVFSIKCGGKNFKEANLSIQNLLKEIEKEARERKAIFELVKEK